MKIYDSVVRKNQSGSTSTIDNIYFDVKIEQFVFTTFVRLPLWTNVMCEIFNSKNFTATSSASESGFKNIKRLMGIKTNRVHVFVNLHLEQITGISKLALASQMKVGATAATAAGDGAIGRTTIRKNRSSSFSKLNGSSDSLASMLNRSQSENDVSDVIRKEYAENWKGRNKSPSLMRRSRKSILNPHDIDYFCQDMPLLRNGFTSKTRRAGKKSIIVTNTCAMDSVFAIYCAAYLDNKVTKDDINNSIPANEFSYFIKTFFTSDEKTKLHYENRTKLLLKIFTKEKYVNQISENKHSITVSCKSEIAGFIEKLVKKDDGRLASVQRTRRCTACEYEDVNYSAIMPLHISINSDVNLFEIERYISVNKDIAFTCRECGNDLIVCQQFKNIIAIEVEPLVHKRMKKYAISHLKGKICVRGESYNLFGIIEHFVSHVKRNSGIWQSVDDLKIAIDTSKRIPTTPIYIFMLFYIKGEKSD